MAAPEDLVILERGNSSLQVHLHGATIISWKRMEVELLYVSPQSHFDNKKAIRGGIPFVFPNFGPWELGPQHGFARISRWNLAQPPKENAIGDVTATFTLQESEQSLAMWNHKFQIDYQVTLMEDSVKLEFDVKNTGDSLFDFTCLLHTYLGVDNVTECTVSGLHKLVYYDKLKTATFTEQQDLVVVNKHVDRVYMNTPTSHTITSTKQGRNIVITKDNLPDTVLWNPWRIKAEEIGDFPDNGYPLMLCVEAGAVSNTVVLEAGSSYHAGQTIRHS